MTNKPDDNTPPPAEAAMLDEYHRSVVRPTLAKGRDLPPVALILRKGTLMEGLGAEFPDKERKNQFAEVMRQRCSRHQADAICLIAEAWALKAEKEGDVDREYDKYGSLEHHPNRVDIVMYQLESRAGNWLGQALIHQKPEGGGNGRMVGKIAWLGQPDRVSGRFSDLLPVQYPTPQQVDAYVALARRKLTAAGLDPERKLRNDSMIGMLEKQVRHASADRLTEATLDKMIEILVLAERAFRRGDDEADD